MSDEQMHSPGALLERAWAQREEGVYVDLFGDLGPGIYPLDLNLFTAQFQQAAVDPRWLHYGVFRSAPNAARTHWTLVTSGLSNPWEQDAPAPVSGLGHELVLECTVAPDWLLKRLQHVLAFDILLAHDRYPGRTVLAPYDRLPLRAPLAPEGECMLTHLMVCPPADPHRYATLESGEFALYSLVGISEVEAAFARAHGGERLEAHLREQGAFPVFDPWRSSVFLPGA